MLGSSGVRRPRRSGRPLVVACSILWAASVAADAPQVIWTWTFVPPSAVNDNVDTVLGVGDIDGDGWPDALAACEDYTVRALSGHATGTPPLIWTFGGVDEKPASGRNLALAPDLDGDGHEEIVYATSANDRSVHLIRSSDGTAIWEYDVRSTGCTQLTTVFRAVSVGDLNRDGVADVAAAVGAPCRSVLALDGAASGEGRLLWLYEANDGFWTVEAAGEQTGDRVPDVLAGAGSNNLDNRGMLLDGRIVPPGDRVIWSYTAGEMVSSINVIDDVTDDGHVDVVLGSWDEKVRMVDGASTGQVTSVVWEHDITQGIYREVQFTEPIPDLDGDCADDVLVGSWSNAVRVLSGATGVPLWTPAPIGTVATQAQAVSPIPDITGDLQWDLVVGTWNPGKVAVLSGADGRRIWEWDAPDNVRSVASIGDIDEDGNADVLAGIQDFARIVSLSGRTLSCPRATREVEQLRAERLPGGRIRLHWGPSDDPCHATYAVFGVPADVDGCFARLVDITAEDEDGTTSNEEWTGTAELFGYLVVSVSESGGKGPLGHFRR